MNLTFFRCSKSCVDSNDYLVFFCWLLVEIVMRAKCTVKFRLHSIFTKAILILYDTVRTCIGISATDPRNQDMVSFSSIALLLVSNVLVSREEDRK